MIIADTNVYVDAVNDPEFRARFTNFAKAHSLAVSSVVVAEILLGKAAAQLLVAEQAMTFSGPALAPAHEDWVAAAAALARLEVAGVKSRSFWNDALLAAQCARLQATLITRNQADFHRLQRELNVRIAAPFPA